MKTTYSLAVALAFALIPGRAGAGNVLSPDHEALFALAQGTTAEPEVSPEEQPRARVEGERAPSDRISVSALGGIEGYTGALAPRIARGPSWGINVGIQPMNNVGLELAYSGAANSVEDPTAAGARIVRNGANVNVKITLAPTKVEPYVFGGVGISRADVRQGGEQASIAGYTDDVFGMVPLGGGLNWQVGRFTAGARLSYNMLFNRDFTPGTRLNSLGIDNKRSGDIWNGVLNLGSTF
jgi:hypothetical protein